MRGRVTCAKDSRLALPVSGIFISRAFRLSCIKPRSTPSSISTVRCVGLPSSSTVSEPRRPGSVPSSTTVTPGEATRCPMRPANAELPLRLKSPSSPCPTASCNSTPGQPGPSRSEEHTSELQSHLNLVCRLLLEKKKKTIEQIIPNTSNKEQNKERY